MLHEQLDYSALAIIISIIIAIAVIISAFATIRIANASKKLGIAQLMEGIERTTNEALEKENVFIKQSVSLAECDIYATSLLNALDRLALLKNQKNIGDEEIRFYRNFLSRALLLLEWKKDTFGQDYSDSYSNLIKLCNDEKIENEDKQLTNIMVKLGKQYKKNREAKLKNNSSPEEKEQHGSENS